MSTPAVTRLPLVTERLASWVEADPDALAFGYLDDGVALTASLTRGELRERSLALAAVLRERLDPGTRVLFLLPPGLEVTIGLHACFAAGLVGVPVALPTPRQAEEGMKRIARVAQDAGAGVILSLGWIRDLLAGDPVLGALPWLTAEGWPTTAPSATVPLPDPGDLAYLQYTSGSTAEPRGVMLTQANFSAQLEVARTQSVLTEAERLYTWVPPWHDMGLLAGILTVTWVGSRAYLARPDVVIRRPRAWLEGMTAHRCTATGGPDFAFRLLVERIAPAQVEGLDLSPLRVIYMGAEPIRPVTLDRFTERFAPAGLDPGACQPGYGLAEVVFAATAKSLPSATQTVVLDRAALGAGAAQVVEPAAAAAQGRDTVELVAVGPADPARIQLVDPLTREAQPDGVVGEIWLRGDDVTQGYWQRPQENARAVGQRIAGEDDGGEGRWLRTGDLGFRLGGELFVSGRLKDVLIVRGVNYHAVDLETAAQEAHETLRIRPVAAFAESPAADDERVTLVVESPADDLHAEHPYAGELLTAVRRGVATTTGLLPSRIVLTSPRTIPRTTSGKVQRGRAREGLASGLLPVVAEWRAPEAPAR